MERHQMEGRTVMVDKTVVVTDMDPLYLKRLCGNLKDTRIDSSKDNRFNRIKKATTNVGN
jgi:hypothetical protein